MMDQKYDLHDVLDNRLEIGEEAEMFGIDLVCQGGGIYHKQPDGYAGKIGEIDSDDYNDVLDLVHELHLDQGMFWEELDEEGREEEAGPLMTDEWLGDHGINPGTGQLEDDGSKLEEAFDSGEMGFEDHD